MVNFQSSAVFPRNHGLCLVSLPYDLPPHFLYCDLKFEPFHSYFVLLRNARPPNLMLKNSTFKYFFRRECGPSTGLEFAPSTPPPAAPVMYLSSPVSEFSRLTGSLVQWCLNSRFAFRIVYFQTSLLLRAFWDPSPQFQVFAALSLFPV